VTQEQLICRDYAVWLESNREGMLNSVVDEIAARVQLAAIRQFTGDHKRHHTQCLALRDLVRKIVQDVGALVWPSQCLCPLA
jgi:hypothetical protein